MSKLQKLIIKVSIVIAVVGSLIGIGAYWGHSSSKPERQHMEEIVDTPKIKDIERIVQSIDIKSEMVLVEEQGITSISLEKYDKEWNSWFTKSTLDIGIEYKVKVGLDMSQLTFVENGDRILVVVGSFKNISTEILNENIVSERALFASEYSHEDISLVKEQMLEQVKGKVMNSTDIKEKSKQSLETFIGQLANSLGVESPIDIVYAN